MPSDILPDRDGMVMQVENSETSEVQVLHPDLVVLSVGMGPAGSMADLAKKFGIRLEDTGFVKTVHDALDTTATLRPGIYVAGTAVAPKDIPDSVALGWIGSHAGIPRRGQVAIGVSSPFTLWWDKKTGSICYIDQTLLPGEERIVACRSVRKLARAIRRLEIRGAPALGVAGAFGVALAASVCRKKTLAPFLATVARDAEVLRATRPTAVNLAGD